MSETARYDVEAETPVNPYSLLEAVNRSSDTAHMGWLIFLGIMAYLLIAVAGVTHRDLLLATPVQLPILGVEIPLVQFFQFAPVLLVLFHLGLVSQLVLLARKTLEFDQAVHQLEPSRRRTHPLRLELHNFFFVQGIAGPSRSLIMGLFLHGMSWLTLVVIPVVLLLFIQFSFLPYHSIHITWTHRVALVVDIVILALLGVFLIRAETHFFQALGRALATHPLTSLLTSVLLAGVVFMSFVVATIPGEWLDRSLRQYFERSAPSSLQRAQPGGSWTDYIPDNPLPLLFADSDGTLFGLFERNLNVTDVDFVVDRDVSPGEPSISLRGRDLRFARLDRSDLHQADMTGANLDGASLTGANLTDVRLNCADERHLILTDERSKAGCASARKAKFTFARLSGASMNAIDLRGADLQEADLGSAQMKYAWLAGANFSSAKLQKSDITGGAKAQGVDFLLANLEGADLTGAQLQYADFSNAAMRGITLEHAQLQGATLRDADLDGAYLRRIRLQGADLSGANMRGADLRQSQVWMTLPPETDRLRLADLRTVVVAPLTKDERNQLMSSVYAIQDPRLRLNVRESLTGLIDVAKSSAWQGSDDARFWASLETIGLPGMAIDYDRELTAYLETLACQSKWSNGAVAEGIARRAINGRFAGDVIALSERFLDGGSCAGGAGLSRTMKASLQAAVLEARERLGPAARNAPVTQRAVSTGGQ